MPLDVLSAQGLTRDDVVAGRDGPQVRAALASTRDVARLHLAAAERLAESADPAVMAAIAPIATVAARLKGLDRPYNPFGPPPDVSQWRLQWAMWRWTRRFGRAASC
ncbi:MAG: phytoene synthase [Xanthobacteraceae bacterium]|nr:MAG: phytoene synthase [Xanthobacteraceae bacterium]